MFCLILLATELTFGLTGETADNVEVKQRCHRAGFQAKAFKTSFSWLTVNIIVCFDSRSTESRHRKCPRCGKRCRTPLGCIFTGCGVLSLCCCMRGLWLFVVWDAGCAQRIEANTESKIRKRQLAAFLKFSKVFVFSQHSFRSFLSLPNYIYQTFEECTTRSFSDCLDGNHFKEYVCSLDINLTCYYNQFQTFSRLVWTICFFCFSWCVLDQWVCSLEVDSLGANVTSKRLLGLAWAYTRHQWPETWNAVKSAFVRPRPNWRQFQTLLETHIASCKSGRLPFCNGNFRTHGVS